MTKKAVFTITLLTVLVATAPLAAQSSAATTNAGSFATGFLSPGCWGTVFGDFGSVGVSNTAADSVPFPTTLGGVQVLIAGVAAPMNFAGAGQINFLVPNGTAVGRQTFVVQVSGMTTYEGSIDIAVSSPGLLTNPNNGADAAAALNQDGSVNGPSSPAGKGEVVVLFGVGPGLLDGSVDDGAPAPADPLLRTTSEVEVFVQAESVPVVFSGLAPNLVNAWQLNITIPADVVSTADGRVALFAVSGRINSQPVVIWVQ